MDEGKRSVLTEQSWTPDFYGGWAQTWCVRIVFGKEILRKGEKRGQEDGEFDRAM